MSAAAPSPAAGDLQERIASAMAAALSWLRQAQLPSGEIPVEVSTDPAMQTGRVADPSVFPTALALHSLTFAGAAASPIAERAADFLLREMSEGGFWRHWSRAHPHYRLLPYDLDDTSCASAALLRAGRRIPDNRSVLAANRARGGMFLTWLLPRARWRGRAHLRATLPALLHPAALLLFFRRTSARPGDVDAVVNANVVHYLNDDPAAEAVAERLVRILEAGAETQSDKWYDDGAVVRYFLSRAVAPLRPDAGSILVRRAEEGVAATPLEAALRICTLGDWERAIPRLLLDQLLQGQLPSGAWPAAAVYHGGRRRLRGGGFAPPHPDTPRWGSEALSTAFAVEALARSASVVP